MGDFLQAITGSAYSSVTPETNSPVEIELPGAPGKYWVIPGLIYSYSGVPSGNPGISISDGTNSLDWDYVNSGSEQRTFSPNWRGAKGATVTVTLRSGGAGVVAKLNIVPAPYLQG